MGEGVGNGLQDQDGLLSDFRADAVAGKDGQVQEHAVSLTETAFALQNPGARAERNFIYARPYIPMMRPSAERSG